MSAKGRIKLTAIVLALALLVGGVVCVASITIYKIFYPIEYTEIVEKYSLEYDLEKEFLYAVIKTESSFKTDALSSAGAQGLMQITPETFEWLQMKMGGEHLVLDCNDADLNVKYGAYFLKLLLDEFENKNTALAAYHAGRGRVNEWLDNPDFSTDGVTLDSIPYRDTEYYVKKVNKAENIYRNLY